MKRMLAILLGMVMLLGGCAGPVQIAMDKVDGTWKDVKDPENTLIFKGRSGRVRFENTDREWAYDLQEGIYVVQYGNETVEGVLQEENGIPVFMIDGRKFVRETDYVQARSEYLANLSREIAEQASKEERIAAFLEEYESLFYSMPAIEPGWSYSLASNLGKVKFAEPWKTEGEKTQLHIKLDLTGAKEMLMARTEGGEVFLNQQLADDLFAGGMSLRWYLFGEPAEEPVNCRVQLIPGKSCEITVDCYWDNLKTRKLAKLDAMAVDYGFGEDRETVFTYIRKEGKPAVYCVVKLGSQEYVLNFSQALGRETNPYAK